MAENKEKKFKKAGRSVFRLYKRLLARMRSGHRREHYDALCNPWKVGLDLCLFLKNMPKRTRERETRISRNYIINYNQRSDDSI